MKKMYKLDVGCNDKLTKEIYNEMEALSISEIILDVAFPMQIFNEQSS